MQLLPAPFPFLNNGSSYRWNLLEKHRSSSTRWTPQLNLGHLQTVPPITWPWTEYLPWKASLFSYQSFVHNISLASSLQLRGQHRSKRKTVGMKEEKPISCSMHIIVVASFTSEQPKKLMVVLPTWTSFVSCLSMRPSITQVVLVVKNLLANAGGIEMWVWSLDQEDPLATHSRRKWLPTPVFLPGESHRQRSLVGYSPWGRKEWETTERTFVFELWCWKRLSRVPWMARRSNQPILKEISPEYSLKGLMLKLKLQYFGHLMRRTDSLEKTLMLGKIEHGRRRGRHRMR